jgi:hypothetical protein
MHVFTQTSFRPDAEAIPNQEHPDQQLRIDQRPPCVGIKGGEMLAYARQINKPIN